MCAPNAERTVELVGKVVEVAPPTRLVITWTNASQAADPSSYSRVSLDVAAYEGMVWSWDLSVCEQLQQRF